MEISTKVRFIAVMTAATIAAGTFSPAQARSDTVTNVAAPRWLDQTVYRPSCRNTERDCGIYVDGSGDLD
ncbi:MAG TPA: hypothetical protein VH230_17400 [Stellaceae bacterium]|jgi:hypothetical protein|nr:hypothetical protein [Stellaceae bacterium]